MRFTYFAELIFLMLLIGCNSNVNFKAKSVDSSQGSFSDSLDGVPQCEINISQLKIDGIVTSFEMQSDVGITLGYNTGGAITTGLGAGLSLKISTADMNASFYGTDPLSQSLIANKEIQSSQTTTSIGVQIDFSVIKLNPSVYFQTPLAKVSETGLSKGVSAIQTQLANLSWVGRVLQINSDGSVVINSGTTSGIQPGDEFDIYNVQHYWEGAPCASHYYGSVHSPLAPIASIKILSAGPGNSIGIYLAQPTQGIKRGAEVIIKSLPKVSKTASARVLKKNIILGHMVAQSIPLPGGGSFNLESVLNTQFADVIFNSGFAVNTN